jgi:hypothetical protein
MSAKLIVKNFIVFALVLLWVYAAASKTMEFKMFKVQMNRQALPLFLKESLVYVLPPLEILTVGLLLSEKTLTSGLCLSAILLSVFTAYIGLAVFKILDKVPCSCGGILSSMGWNVHFIFNLIFLLLTFIGIYVFRRERRAGVL